MSRGEPTATSARLDIELVRRGLARSRTTAAEVISRGLVSVDGQVVRRPARDVEPAEDIDLFGPGGPWVGRAAYKLLGALDAFASQGLSVEGRRCLDIGASTGGFTQVLLHHGASLVVALDVGHDQLAPQLASNPRVVERSRINIRDVASEDLGGPFDVVVADLSFISLRLVLGTVADLVAADGDVIALIKPQFEVGRARLGKGGIVRDQVARIEAIRGVVDTAASLGLRLAGLLASPLTGSTGNQEYLGWWSAHSALGPSDVDIERVVTGMDHDR